MLFAVDEFYRPAESRISAAIALIVGSQRDSEPGQTKRLPHESRVPTAAHVNEANNIIELNTVGRLAERAKSQEGTLADKIIAVGAGHLQARRLMQRAPEQAPLAERHAFDLALEQQMLWNEMATERERALNGQ